VLEARQSIRKVMKVLQSSVANGVSLVSAFFSVLPLSCCVFPVALSFLGASGLAFAATLEPYRAYFLGGTLISLAAGFYFTYRTQREDCLQEAACAVPKSRKVQLLFLWIVTMLVLAMLAFPYLVPYLTI
jgi:mercuric ion transport protein